MSAAATAPKISSIPFVLTEKMKFSIKAALSIVLVYLICFVQGWPTPLTAATTVMLIAAVGPIGDSVIKGLLRIVGTVIGAIVGMGLIALFPQERLFYLFSVSLIVTLLLYLARAYKGDTTVFMLAAITVMMTFKGGETDNVFLFGIDKTFMTVLGIAVYTLVGILLWPVDLKNESTARAQALTQTQRRFFRHIFGSSESDDTKEHDLRADLLSFKESLSHVNGGMENGFSRKQWQSVVNDMRGINETLTLLQAQTASVSFDKIKRTLPLLDDYIEKINDRFAQIERAWTDDSTIQAHTLPPLHIDHAAASALTPLEKATHSGIAAQMRKLFELLESLTDKLNALHAPAPTRFRIENVKNTYFRWFDIEDLQGALITFLLFWTGTMLWIHLNPPGGFLFVAVATGLSVITTFTPIKPSALIAIFSLSFIFSTAAYVLILPHLTYGWELALFLFLYTFAGFYLFPEQVAIFFLLGISTWNIANEMYYAFDIYLMILLLFYAFLFLLLFFYYIPFSHAPERLFLRMLERFDRLASTLARYGKKNAAGVPLTLMQRMRLKYARNHLLPTIEKMKIWSKQIDLDYFDRIDSETLDAFVETVERFGYLLMRLERDTIHDPIIREYLQNPKLISLEESLAQKHAPTQAELQEAYDNAQSELDKLVKKHFALQKSDNDLIGFYEEIALRKLVWQTLLSMKKLGSSLPLGVLKESRF